MTFKRWTLIAIWKYYQTSKLFDIILLAQSAGAVEYTDCISTERKDRPPKNVQYITVNNQMLMF